MTNSQNSTHRHNRRRRHNCALSFRIGKCFFCTCVLVGFFYFTATEVVWGRRIWPVPASHSQSTVTTKSYDATTTQRRNKQGLAEDNDGGGCFHDKDRARRRFLLLGRSNANTEISAGQSTNPRKANQNKIEECSLLSDDGGFRHDFDSEDRLIFAIKNVDRRIPVPWPINLIQERWNNRGESSSSRAASENKNAGELNDSTANIRNSSFPSMGALIFAYTKQQARIVFRQVSEISSQVLFNLPPSAPPLICLASIPRNVRVWQGENVVAAASNDYSLKRTIPIFSDPFARSLVLAGLGMAVLSWSNQEIQRKRKLTPLALPAISSELGTKWEGRVSKVFLPPFLPEDVPEPEIDALLKTAAEESQRANGRGEDLFGSVDEENILSRVSPKIRRHLNGIYETTTTTPRRFFKSYYSDWVQGRAVRKREVAKIRRNRVFDELIALQALKKRQAASRNKADTQTPIEDRGGTPELGYALVTGASRGIGRAIAVELARWEIPLVLVARDVNKLVQLASDLEACYGAKCCVLEADLSKTNAAERIHEATTKAGISVDILINNAGAASEGLAVDEKTSMVERMVMLNSLTYAKLSVLYGQDMKERRRGRILMMSSMAGLCNASPNTAVYGACKAFGKSLALSMAKEMETYGVGVTCLIPGAVADTDFRASSGTHKALCWYLPFYSRSPDMVAHQGVLSLLDGDTQSIPGWQNRAFANIVRPVIPQRLETMIVQIAFTPLRIPSLSTLWRNEKSDIQTDDAEILISEFHSPKDSLSSDGGSAWLSFKPRYTTQPPPRFLKLREDEPKEVESKSYGLDGGNTAQEESSLPSPTMESDKNTTKAEISEDVINESDSAPNTPDATHRSDNTTMISETESNPIEHRHEPPVRHHKTHFRDTTAHNPENSNHTKERTKAKSNGVRDNLLPDRRSINPPRQKNEGNRERRKQGIPSKRDKQKITEGNRFDRMQKPEWLDYQEDDDDTFSTKLGPITMKERKETLLSKQKIINQ